MSERPCDSCGVTRTIDQTVTLADGRQLALCGLCVDASRHGRAESIKRLTLTAGQPVRCPHGHGVENIEGEGTGELDGQHVAYARCLQCDQLIAATWHTDAGQESLL